MALQAGIRDGWVQPIFVGGSGASRRRGSIADDTISAFHVSARPPLQGGMDPRHHILLTPAKWPKCYGQLLSKSPLHIVIVVVVVAVVVVVFVVPLLKF